MKKLIAKLIHWIDPVFFEGKSLWYLNKWGIQDIYKGIIVWNCKHDNPLP